MGVLFAMALVGCYGPPGAAVGPSSAPGTGDGLQLIDAAIDQISASSPTKDAAAALDACGITNFNPDQPGKVAANFGTGIVTGMGLVTPGRDANKYAPLGSAPEIQTDSPIWVITTNSDWISFPTVNGELRNATCVVPAGDWGRATWFATGDVRIDNAVVTPKPELPPTLRLPALAP